MTLEVLRYKEQIALENQFFHAQIIHRDLKAYDLLENQLALGSSFGAVCRNVIKVSFLSRRNVEWLRVVPLWILWLLSCYKFCRCIKPMRIQRSIGFQEYRKGRNGSTPLGGKASLRGKDYEGCDRTKRSPITNEEKPRNNSWLSRKRVKVSSHLVHLPREYFLVFYFCLVTKMQNCMKLGDNNNSYIHKMVLGNNSNSKGLVPWSAYFFMCLLAFSRLFGASSSKSCRVFANSHAV